MSRNAFAQLDSDESDNEDMKTDNNVGNTEEDANSVGETNNINNDSSNARKTMSLKAQWERHSRGNIHLEKFTQTADIELLRLDSHININETSKIVKRIF